jgi:hypothetical protein
MIKSLVYAGQFVANQTVGSFAELKLTSDYTITAGKD